MFFGKSNRADLTEDNKIIINVWLPRVNGQIVSAENFIKSHMKGRLDGNQRNAVGHVSMQTSNHYVSWWPGDSIVGAFHIVPASNSNFATDCEQEKGKPDCTIVLYSLNSAEVESAFSDVKNTKKLGYVLAGEKAATRLANLGSEAKGQSCCGLAYDLLMAGGLSELTSWFKDWNAKYGWVTPDNFCDLVKRAKDNELYRYPETARFSLHDDVNYPNEYHPAVAPKNQCLVM